MIDLMLFGKVLQQATSDRSQLWKNLQQNPEMLSFSEIEIGRLLTVKPNWMGPNATIRTQARTETERSLII